VLDKPKLSKFPTLEKVFYDILNIKTEMHNCEVRKAQKHFYD